MFTCSPGNFQNSPLSLKVLKIHYKVEGGFLSRGSACCNARYPALRQRKSWLAPAHSWWSTPAEFRMEMADDPGDEWWENQQAGAASSPGHQMVKEEETQKSRSRRQLQVLPCPRKPNRLKNVSWYNWRKQMKMQPRPGRGKRRKLLIFLQNQSQNQGHLKTYSSWWRTIIAPVAPWLN